MEPQLTPAAIAKLEIKEKGDPPVNPKTIRPNNIINVNANFSLGILYASKQEIKANPISAGNTTNKFKPFIFRNIIPIMKTIKARIIAIKYNTF